MQNAALIELNIRISRNLLKPFSDDNRNVPGISDRLFQLNGNFTSDTIFEEISTFRQKGKKKKKKKKTTFKFPMIDKL